MFIFRGLLSLVFLLSLSANSCAKPQSQVQIHVQIQNDFYEGLLNKSESRHKARMISNFERALNSPNEYIRQAAADELANLMYDGNELSSRTMEKVRNEASGAWAGAFASTGKNKDKEKALDFLLNFEQGTAVPNQARLYVMREFESEEEKGEDETLFDQYELAAVNGHYAVSRQQYAEALGFFRKFMLEPETPASIPANAASSANAKAQWPGVIPQLFLEYPNLVNDLGRAFQYTSSGKEGSDLFLLWEKNLDEAIATDDLRYSLYFYTGRIMRRRGANEEAFSVFEKAHFYAPEGEQSDACIWYLLDLSSLKSVDVFLQRLENLVGDWHKDTYFDDILEKYLQTLVSKKDWKNIIRTFAIIKETEAASRAAYAWKIARLIEEKYITGADMQAAAAAIRGSGEADENVEEYLSTSYMRFAYEAGNSIDSFSLYYRSLSAASLGLPLLELMETSEEDEEEVVIPVRAGRTHRSSRKAVVTMNKEEARRMPAAFEFLLGFFEYGASSLCAPYIRAFEYELSSQEMRVICGALAQAGMYVQSIRHSSRYVNRAGFNPSREDMEILFPHPYEELVDEYAAQHDISPSLMYGLIRTESAFQSSIVSRAGAVGLTQLMPSTAREMAGRIRRSGGPDLINSDRSIDLNDPGINIHIGAFYLNYLIKYFNDPLISLMAYNGGMNRIRRLRASNSSLPADIFLEIVSISETRNYGRQVMAAAAVYEELYYERNR
jgi:soluble lytic murein transglycosylase